MADQFLGFDLSTQQLKGKPHHAQLPHHLLSPKVDS